MFSLPPLSMIGLAVVAIAAMTAAQVNADGALGRGPHVMNAWIPAPPPGAPMHAGYMMLHNADDEARAVIGVSSPSYAEAQLHLSEIKDGVATMQHLAQVEIAPGGMTRFKPGGLHIMLLKPKRKITVGDVVRIVLSLDDGSTVTAEAMVRKRHGGGAHHHHKGS